MPLPKLLRAARAVRWRLQHETKHRILFAAPLPEPPAVPHGYRPIRIRSGDAAGAEWIVAAMRAAGETEDPVRRLEQGHECFAWEQHGTVVAYGWVCFRERNFGGRRLLDRNGRAFCYQFYTAPEQRGKGLYTSLLLQVRHELEKEGQRELLIDVRVDNEPSHRGIVRAGFAPVMEVVVQTWLCRYRRWGRYTSLQDEIPVIG